MTQQGMIIEAYYAYARTQRLAESCLSLLAKASSNAPILPPKGIKHLTQYVNSPALVEREALDAILSAAPHLADTSQAVTWACHIVEMAETIRALHNRLSIVLYRASRWETRCDVAQLEARDDALRASNAAVLFSEILLGRTSLISLPTNLQLEPTDRCNAKCKPCPHCTSKGRVYHDLDTSSLHKIEEVIATSQFTELFGLGEPSLAPVFPHIAQRAQLLGSEVHVITNGADLAENPIYRTLHKIGVSVDGDNPATFETIRTGLSFHKVIENIRRFRAANPQIFLYLTATINRANLDEIPGIARLARELNVDAVCFHRMTTTQKALKDAMLRNEDILPYKQLIESASALLAGSTVQLFDYAMLDKLRNEEAPLSKGAAQKAFDSFKPEQEPRRPPLEQIQALLGSSAPVPPPSWLLASQSQGWRRLWTSVVGCFGWRRRVLTKPSTKPLDRGAPSSLLSILPSTPEAPSGRASELSHHKDLLLPALGSTPPERLRIPYCLSPWTRFVLKADGRMFPCSCWSHSYQNIHKMDKFSDAWNGEFLVSLRESFLGERPLHDACRACTTIDRYQGLPELIQFAQDHSIDLSRVPTQPGFDPPEGKRKL